MHHNGQRFICHTILPGDPAFRGRGMIISFGYHRIPAGEILLGRSGDRLCYLGFVIDSNRDIPLTEMRAHFPYAQITADDDDAAMVKRVENAWRGRGDIDIELHGTPFQLSVWKALLEIPSGATVTYRDIAVQIDRPKAIRAVGGAVGANPVSLLVPCHRVLPASGGVGDYLWGKSLKKHILALESEDASRRAA